MALFHYGLPREKAVKHIATVIDFARIN